MAAVNASPAAGSAPSLRRTSWTSVDLARAGFALPVWYERLGEVRAELAWRYRDVFGDH